MTDTEWEQDCNRYLELDARIKELTKEQKPIKERLKKEGEKRTDKFQVIMTETEAFRMKSIANLQKEGWTKKELQDKGMADHSYSTRMAVSRI